MPSRISSSSVNKTRIVRYAVSSIGVIAFMVVGLALLVGSHAETLNYSMVLGYQNRTQTAGVTDIPATVNDLGTETVSSVGPGAQLDYQLSNKAAITQECYLVSVSPPAGGLNTASVQFVGQGKTLTLKLSYDPTQVGNFQKVCVGSGGDALLNYNVFNKSSAGGPNVLVYQDIVTM